MPPGRRKRNDHDRQRAVLLGKAFAVARADSDLSQQQLALNAGVSIDTLRSIEQSRVAAPSFFLIAALARPLALSLDELANAVESGS